MRPLGANNQETAGQQSDGKMALPPCNSFVRSQHLTPLNPLCERVFASYIRDAGRAVGGGRLAKTAASATFTTKP